MEETIQGGGEAGSGETGPHAQRADTCMNSDNPIPVVCVTRNNLHLSKKAIASALAQDVPVEVLVVDNCSADGTPQWLATKSLTTISPPEQWSLAKCWNVALATLWHAGHGAALVINNDVELRPDTARLLNSHGGQFVTCVSVDTRERMGVEDDRRIEDLRTTERPHPDFSAFFIRKSVTDRGIWFNEECFPGYAEDSFFHVEMHCAGIRAVCVDLPFLHHGAATVKWCGDGERARIKRGADANRQRFRAKYGCLPGSKEYEALFI